MPELSGPMQRRESITILLSNGFSVLTYAEFDANGCRMTTHVSCMALNQRVLAALAARSFLRSAMRRFCRVGGMARTARVRGGGVLRGWGGAGRGLGAQFMVRNAFV